MQKNRIKPETRVLARDGLFVVLDRLDLVRRLAGRVELVTQPLPSDAPRQLEADHPLTEAQHLRVTWTTPTARPRSCRGR